MSIKDMLKNIFPLPAKKQRQEFAAIKARLKEQEQVLEKNRLEIKHQEESFSKGLVQIQEYLQKMNANIIPKVLWSSNSERDFVKLNWGDVTKQKDFAEKFIKLTKGMDAKSIQTIIRILSREKTYLNSDKGGGFGFIYAS